jgi:hypothetical protein
LAAVDNLAVIRRLVVIGGCPVLVAVLAACGGPAPTSSGVTPTTQVSVTTTTSTLVTTPSPKPDGRPRTWTMPDLTGSNLQDAQDTIQKLTDNAIFVTTSHDATGARRQQVLDRNWKVCSQNVPPGKTITADMRIEFGAVKLDESCP